MGTLRYNNFNSNFVHSGAEGRNAWALDYSLSTEEVDSQIRVSGTLKLRTTGLVEEKSVKCGISTTTSGGDYGSLKSSGTLPSLSYTW